MSLHNWRIGGKRSGNDVVAHPQRLDATDDSTRYALGRNVKGERTRHHGGGITYDIVEVWTLRQRDASGRAQTVDTHRSREAAIAWVERGER